MRVDLLIARVGPAAVLANLLTTGCRPAGSSKR
jgi:hypothetical protein